MAAGYKAYYSTERSESISCEEYLYKTKVSIIIIIIIIIIIDLILPTSAWLLEFNHVIVTGCADMRGQVKSISAVSKNTMVRVGVAIYSGKYHKNTADQIVRFDVTENLIKGNHTVFSITSSNS